MNLNNVLSNEGWELLIWTHPCYGTIGIVGPDGDVLNYLKDYINCNCNVDTCIIQDLDKCDEIPFVVADDVNNAIIEMDYKLGSLPIESKRWKSKVTNTILEAAYSLGYVR